MGNWMATDLSFWGQCAWGRASWAQMKPVAAKGGHEPARAGLGASRLSARENLARLGLARCAFGPEKWARPELAKNSVQLELARDNT
jgi:hypothetical protein